MIQAKYPDGRSENKPCLDDVQELADTLNDVADRIEAP